MLVFFLLASMMITDDPVRKQVDHICWIKHVQLEGSGVRIFLIQNAPRVQEEGILLQMGASYSLANSGHDSCTLTAVRQGDNLGVEAKAFFYMPLDMEEPMVRKEWIAAYPGP